MNAWTGWSLKLLLVLLALSGFAAGADQMPGPAGARGPRLEPVSSAGAWSSLSQAMNPPLAMAALLLPDALSSGDGAGPASEQQLRAADEATQPCESSAGLLLLACLLAPVLRLRRGRRAA